MRGVRRERALAYLRAHGPASAAELAAAINTVKRNAQHILRRLHEAGEVHIAAWRKQHGEGPRGRPPIRLWAAGPGVDAPKPPRDSCRTVRKRRCKRLREKYGPDYLRIIRPRGKGGASVIVRDGVVIYRRGASRGRNGGREQRGHE